MLKYIQMGKNVKKLFLSFTAVMLFVAVVVSLCGCSLFYHFQTSEDGKHHYGVGKKDAIFISYEWDGTEQACAFEIPDTFSRVPVTQLGGWVGRGVPSPFGVRFPYEYNALSKRDLDDTEFLASEFPEGYEVQKLVFTVRLGKNVKNLEYIDECIYYQEGSDAPTVLIVPELYFECSEENKTFYSENGILYLRKTDAPAEWNYQTS
ncbi:MAG: hypothetical protein K2K12_05065 [Clostridia bacterium]|nr:hypothetical protein [Clostridia bacterium]